jgi:hypothetical protein
MQRLTTQLALGAFVALAAAGTPCLADETAASQSTVSTDAMRVVRDKTTGKLRAPSDSELQQMLDAEKAERKARGKSEPAADRQPVQVRTYASGMKAAVLGPEYLVSLEARSDADGNLTVRHANPADVQDAAPTTALPTE